MCDEDKGYFDQVAAEIAERNLGKEAWDNMDDRERQEAADKVAMGRQEIRDFLDNL